MKHITKFIFATFLFTIPIVIYYSAKTIWLLMDDRYKESIYGNEVYKAIEKSKKRNKARKLFLGDSTANQFYNCKKEDSPNTYSLTCTQAIGMVGQYILLHNYLNAGNRPDSVFLIYTPFSFWDNLDQIYTYHYFLKPFFYDEYKPLMTQIVMEQVRKIPKYWACHFPFIQTTGWAPEIKPQERNYTFLSPISSDYLEKIDSLSKEYCFNLEIVPTFVAKHWEHEISLFNRDEFVNHECCAKLTQYLHNISFLPDTCFIDEVHLKHPELYKHRMDSLLYLR